MGNRSRVYAAALSVSIAGFATWMSSEHFRSAPYVPTKGDEVTIGYGSTHYENGQKVKLTDKPITEVRAQQLARNLMSKDEIQFRKSIPNVKLYQEEYDVYLDFVGQYGIGNWRMSGMRRNLLEGRYVRACDSLLKWKMQAGRDCSVSSNWGSHGCKGVWTRQLERHKKCMSVQG